MNSLSTHINRASSAHDICPIKIAKDLHLSHNIFVDDILVFAMQRKDSWRCILQIFQRFKSASGICINKRKSKLYHNETDQDTASWIADLFGIEAAPIDLGMKYLGFTLKPMGYKTGDWNWLLDRLYNRISGWESRLLSLAGRQTLIQTVLAQLAIYWSHLFYLPAKIISKMKAFVANFLWGGKTFQSKLHLVKLDSLTRPKKTGGWGILDMRKMGNALLCKSYIRGIYGNGPWSVFINRKYLKGKGIEFWYRRNSLGIKRGSAIWLSFCKNKTFLLKNFRWSIHSGANVFLGNDLIRNGLPSFPHPFLIDFLHLRGLFTWDRLIKSWNNLKPVWKEAGDLSLPP